MSTYTITITGTYISPFSDCDKYNILHGGYLIDPMASPLSFFYASTANGGYISTIYNNTLNGGVFKISYDDLRENTITLDGHYIFCDTDVIFDLSNFDQTVSKIIKVVFDAGNGEDIQTYTSYVSNSQVFYPELSGIETSYYPGGKYYTNYTPSFKIFYLDGNVMSITIPLTSVQCGIYESYKNKKIVDVIPLYKNTGDVITFINDTSNDDLTIVNVSPLNTFEPEFETIQIPLTALSPLALELLHIPTVPQQNNPILPGSPVVANGIITLGKDYIRRFISNDYVETFTNLNAPLIPPDFPIVTLLSKDYIRRFVSNDYLEAFTNENGILTLSNDSIRRFVSNDFLRYFVN